MKTPALSPLAQIEWTLEDLEGARELLRSLFGAEPVEEAFCAALAGPHMDIAHLGLGQAVLQLCRPRIEALGHARALQQWGPHVYNLTFFVDDLEALRERVRAANLEFEWDYPLREIYERVIPPENLSGSLEALMVDARERIGFHLELAETPWATEPEPRLVYPAYHPDWRKRDERVGPLERINVVTPDIEGALSTLSKVFGDALKLHLAPVLRQPDGVVEAEVELGLVRIHYLQPSGGASSDLAVPKIGAAVHSLALPVFDLAAVSAVAADRGIRVEPCSSMLFDGGHPTDRATWRIGTGATLGIDLIVRDAG